MERASSPNVEAGICEEAVFASLKILNDILPPIPKYVDSPHRREEIQALLGKNEAVMSLCVFPRYACLFGFSSSLAFSWIKKT